jgi:hypothetical protein
MIKTAKEKPGYHLSYPKDVTTPKPMVETKFNRRMVNILQSALEEGSI